MPAPPRSRRVGARAVDLVVLLWAIGFVAVEVEGRFLGGDPLATRVAQPVTSGQMLMAVLAAVLVLEVVPTALWGRTPGKALLGIRVVAAEARAAPGRDSPPGFVRSVLRAATLFLPLAVPYAAPALVAGVALSALVLPGGRGVHDLVAGTVAVDAPLERAATARHRYPRRAIAPLPLPEVAKATLVEVGLPSSVDGVFRVDRRMAVYDETLFTVGTDPAGRSLCVVSPTGEVVAVQPAGTGPPLPAATSLPRFVDLLDAHARAPGRLAAHLAELDPAVLDEPTSWWHELAS